MGVSSVPLTLAATATGGRFGVGCTLLPSSQADSVNESVLDAPVDELAVSGLVVMDNVSLSELSDRRSSRMRPCMSLEAANGSAVVTVSPARGTSSDVRRDALSSSIVGVALSTGAGSDAAAGAAFAARTRSPLGRASSTFRERRPPSGMRATARPSS